ncbi:tetratricopeptide repeat protein [Terrabacter sp. BE26]|uniref:tetratricopeptide repeat protein n=1 Tax=Terrabacter sp. BE26 TaxID=2898152 RepID=UPI0035BE392B
MNDTHFVLGVRHFGRFTRSRDENDAAIAEARDALVSAVDADPGQPDAPDVLDATVDLAEALTVAHREPEAVALAAPAVALAREAGRAETLGWALLVLATAEHYADLPADAEPHFVEALTVARTSGDEVLEHHTLHHLGRFLVDTERADDAILAFEAALEIRERLGEPRAAGTRAAVEALTGDR